MPVKVKGWMPLASTALVAEMLAFHWNSPETLHGARVFKVPYCPHTVPAAGNNPPSGEGLWAVRERRGSRGEQRDGGAGGIYSEKDCKGHGTKM